MGGWDIYCMAEKFEESLEERKRKIKEGKIMSE